MSSATAKSDFVQVVLTAAGVAKAGTGGVLKIANGHFNYAWQPGTSVRVLTSEWRKCFSKMLYQGQPIFQLAPATSATTAAPPSLSQLKAQQAKINAEIAADEASGQK
jgi:hypothetical protein